MNRPINRAFLAVAAAGATVATLGFTGASGAGASTAQPAAALSRAAAAIPGQQLWVARHSDGRQDGATAVAASPDGTEVFVTGTTYVGDDMQPEFTTVAYSAASGAQLWIQRYSGMNGAVGGSIAVSPDSSRVYVLGNSPWVDGAQYITLAYDTASGALEWEARYSKFNPYEYGVRAAAMALSADGKRLVVTGTGFGRGDYVTVAYNAWNGTRLWAKVYDGPANGRDDAVSVAISPTGRVFVTGSSDGWAGRYKDYATVAYRGGTGAQVWVKRYNGPGSRNDTVYSMAVSPDGARVYVTGGSYGGAVTRTDYATVAYRADTGAQVWVKRYNPANRHDEAHAVAVSPTGRVFVTGTSNGANLLSDYATVAYRGATGEQVWVKRYNGPANGTDSAASISVSRGGDALFVTGSSDGAGTASDYATVAYTATGARLWASRYDGPPTFEGPAVDHASDVAVSYDGTRVFVTGSSAGDYATVAYHK